MKKGPTLRSRRAGLSFSDSRLVLPDADNGVERIPSVTDLNASPLLERAVSSAWEEPERSVGFARHYVGVSISVEISCGSDLHKRIPPRIDLRTSLNKAAVSISEV